MKPIARLALAPIHVLFIGILFLSIKVLELTTPIFKR